MTDVRMKGFGKRSSVAEAQALIAQRVGPLGTEKVPFRAALGRILAQDVVSPKNVPPHPRSAMDGYCIRSEDAPGSLQVIGELMAAQTPEQSLGPGQALRIMTGARIPLGANAVVMVEDVRLSGDLVTVPATPVGHHILEAGADLRLGEPVLAAGRRLRPQDVSMLATLGATEISVARRPRVRIIPSGNELVPVGTAPSGSQVIESNSYLLEGLALRDGAEPELHPIVRDEEGLLAKVLSAPGADLIVVSGGSSVGQEDFAPVILRRLGELPIHGVLAKPASPTGIGFIGATPVVLAPGYPVASFVAWDLFVRPLVQQMLGLQPFWPYVRTRVRLAEAIKKPGPRVDIVRVTLKDGLAHPIPGGAALLSTVTRADAFLLLDAGQDHFEAGTEIEAFLYG